MGRAGPVDRRHVRRNTGARAGSRLQNGAGAGAVLAQVRAVSDDLENWTKIPDAIFGTNRYTACPCMRYVNGYYYVLYLENRSPRHYYETYITRSRDLKKWEISSANPVLRPIEIDDSINASDPEIVEFKGKTYIYYSVGDQLTWMNIKRLIYPGSLESFCEMWYRQPGIEDHGTLYVPSA